MPRKEYELQNREGNIEADVVIDENELEEQQNENERRIRIERVVPEAGRSRYAEDNQRPRSREEIDAQMQAFQRRREQARQAERPKNQPEQERAKETENLNPAQQQELEERRKRNELNQRQDQEIRRQKVSQAPKAKEKPPVGKEREVNKKKVNPFKGTVNAQSEIDEALLDTQQKEAHSLRYLTREVTFGARHGFSSPEFRLVKKRLYLLDKFMQSIAGRTQLTQEETERYEYFTMSAYKATQMYEKKKDAEEKELQRRGKKPSQYEQKRRLAIKEVQQSIAKMREDMYDKDLKRKKDELRHSCQEKLQDMQETLDGINHERMKDAEIREALTGAVSKTLYFMNRMDSLEKNIKLKPGKSYKQTTEHMEREIRPTQQELDSTAKNDLTRNIVEEGMKAIKSGKKFTVDDIEKLQKDYIQTRARKMAQELRQKDTLQNQRSNNQPELNRQEVKKMPNNVM